MSAIARGSDKEWSAYRDSFIGDSGDTLKCHGAVEETGGDFQERARRAGQEEQGAERAAAAEAGRNGYACVMHHSQRGVLSFYKWSTAESSPLSSLDNKVNEHMSDHKVETCCKLSSW